MSGGDLLLQVILCHEAMTMSMVDGQRQTIVTAGPPRYSTRFHHATQNAPQFKIELFLECSI